MGCHGTNEVDTNDLETVLGRTRAQASVENVRITQHAHQEMVMDNANPKGTIDYEM